VSGAPETILRAEGITYGYRKGHPILDGIDTTVHAETITAITGPSGRGKSTLLYILAGLLKPWPGDVEFRGLPERGMSDAERARRRATSYGFVFQDVVLDARRTILEAVLEPCLYAGLPRSDYEHRAGELLDEMGVQLTAGSLPGQISGGQAQRVGVCRALLLSPSVIFADEPTGNLDSSSSSAVMSALEGAAGRGCAVLVATHDDRVVARCTGRIHLS